MSTTIILIYIIFIIIILLSLNCKSLRLYKWIQLIFHHDDTIEIQNSADYEKINNNINNNNNIKKQIVNCLNGGNSNNNCNNRSVINDIWLIPGPPVLPIFGTKWIYFWRYKINKIHEAYKDLNRIYGQIVLEVASGGVPIILLYDRTDIDKVLRYPSKYPFRPPTEIVTIYRKNRPDRYASAGIPNEQGERWHHLRTKLTPFITSPKTLALFLPILNTICDDFIDLIKYKRDVISNTVDNFQDLANLMGLEAVCMLMLGRRMGFLSKEQQPNDNIKQLAIAVKQLFISQHDSFYGFGLWKYLPTATYRQFAKSEDIIYNIISEMVDNTLLDEQLECNDNDVRSVFISILQTNDLDIKDKKSAIIDFIAAGIETLANTLTFIMFHLSKNPNAQERIYKEFTQTMHTDGTIIHEQLSKAVYTKACLQESFRLSPTAFALARILEEDTILSGFNIKAGSIVLCQTMLACHNDKNFVNAGKFLPERWLNSDNNKINNTDGEHVTRPVGCSTTLVAPFGVGKRMCPGKRFVEMEVILLIAKITKQFFIEFNGELDTQCEFLLAPKTPVNIILTDRR